MEAVYALLGIFLGIAIDEVVRNRRGVRSNVVRTTATAKRRCHFVAQDYYDL
jgi:hypothetical protein